MTVSVVILRGLMAAFRARGLPIGPLLAAAGVVESDVSDLRGRLSAEQWERARLHAESLLQEQTLGLSLARGTCQQGLPVFGQLLVAADSLREAVALAQRYSPLVVDELSIAVDEQQGGDARLICALGSPLSEAGSRFFAEFWTMMAVCLAQVIVPSARPQAVRFRHRAPAAGQLYETLFDCPVQFDASRDEVVFEAALLDVPNLHGDETMRAVLREAADQLLASLPEGLRLVSRVRAVLRTQDLPVVDLDTVARRVGLSRRALARRLRVEGHTVSSLIFEQRKDAACRDLASPDCCIKVTAERLGYSEPSAFHRAFKRWTGETPAQYAKAHKRGVPQGATGS